MKRKHSDVGSDPPAAADSTEADKGSNGEEEATFASLGLDPRLLQALAEQRFQKPTLVQRKAIPPALEGRDVLARAKTGSGKTAAYVLPILQAILKRKQSDSTAFTSALILVPTRELAEQVYWAVSAFGSFCARDVSVAKLADARQPDAVLRSLLAALPDVVVATPARALHAIQGGMLGVERLTRLVLDEADLVLSYGYDDDLQKVALALPKAGVRQTTLTSATLSPDVDALKGLFCRDPVVLDLEEPEAEGEGVQQYVVRCGEDEKFLLAYVIFKLRLITGKCIIFVADTDRCYRLKLFFEQFGIRSCVLNSELPVNSRIHAVEEFNRNVYDIIIAADENEVLGDEDDGAGEDEADGDVANANATNANKKQTKKGGEDERRSKKRKFRQKDKEYGVSRGIDFKNVATVVNFDLPTSSKSYTHRIGRTARAGQTGMALSFVVPRDLYRKHMPTSVASAESDEKVLARVTRQQAKRGKDLKEYNFDMKQVDAFRYRMNDALRAVTKVAVREARTRELRNELIKSDRLKRHFEENPAELHHLRHDGELRAARTQPHLRHVPDYLLPPEGRKALTSEEIGFVPMRKKRGEAKDRKKFFKKGKTHGLTGKGRRSDPLRTFKAGKGRRK